MTRRMLASQPPAGLYYLADILLPDLAEEFLAWFRDDSVQDSLFPVRIDGNPPPVGLRKVLHFGYFYDYFNGRVSGVAEPMPPIIEKLRDLVMQVSDVIPSGYEFNQCVVNRYLPGEEIPPHKDHSSFDEFIAVLTVGCGGILEFHRPNHPSYVFRVEPGSLYIMSGASRHEFLHAARNEKTNPKLFPTVDQARISITFRSFDASVHLHDGHPKADS